MNGRKALSLTVAIVAVIALLTASGAYSSITADRGLQVSVVDDDQAYLAIEKNDPGEVKENETVRLFNVTNQFSSKIDVTVDFTEEPDGLEPDTVDREGLESGDVINVSAKCTDTDQDMMVAFTVSAESESANVETDERKMKLTCTSSDG
ncbi:hypothetical protein ACLI4Y_07155 [Natrialbaceae archaeon A-CW3]